MSRALNQGLLGRALETLAPSRRALGPNTYLTRNDFLRMLGAAFLFHALVIGIIALWPQPAVKNIPVRAIAFKLGGGERLATSPMQTTLPPPLTVPAPTAVGATPTSPNAKTAETPAIAPNPQQHVREVGAAPIAPALTAKSGASADEVRTRYEQDISGWIQRHKYYPPEAGGREGRAVVRVRIDRAGNVRYYAIEQSSGVPTLDEAALDMIRRANPVPAVPTLYPGGNLVEFLIPITFRAPK